MGIIENRTSVQSIVYQNLNQPNEAQTDLQTAIGLAQTKYAIGLGI